MEAPFFSIVTVCRNAGQGIAATAESLRAQGCRDIEWIVVDGASTDDTCEIVNGYLDLRRDTLLSEPDDGVYFAMNKGLRLAKGEVVQFLNAGDVFSGPHVLERVKEAFGDDVDVVYGDSLFALADGRMVCRVAGDMNVMLYRRMPVCHQALFVRRIFHLRHLFDETLRIASDYASIASMNLAGARIRYLPEPLNINAHEAGAVSIAGRGLLAAENYFIQRHILGLSRFAAGANYARTRMVNLGVRLLQRLPRRAFRLLPEAIRKRVY